MNVLLRPPGLNTWLNLVKASVCTFKIPAGGCRDLVLLQTSLIRKFPSLLHLSLTHLEWSASLFHLSFSSLFGGQFTNQQSPAQIQTVQIKSISWQEKKARAWPLRKGAIFEIKSLHFQGWWGLEQVLNRRMMIHLLAVNQSCAMCLLTKFADELRRFHFKRVKGNLNNA